MIAALGLLRYWKLGLAVAVAAVIVVGWLMLKAAWAEKDAAELREKAALAALNQVMDVNLENLTEMARWKLQAEEAEQAVRQDQALLAARAAQLRAIRQEIVADASDSCPVAPVLRRALDGVRSLRAAPGGDEDPGRAGDAAGGAADLPD